jgi:hypothetical protein
VEGAGGPHFFFFVFFVALCSLFSCIHQLEVDVSTDILIGVHGAGMTQLLFLPKHAAVIEVHSRD